MGRKKVFIFCMGFARRDLDAQRLFHYFTANGCTIVANPRRSDINILVTCAFCKTREDEAFTLIHTFKRYRGELIILGCLPGIAPGRLSREFKGRSLPAKSLEAVDSLFPDFKIKFAEIPDSNDLYINKIEYGLAERLWKGHIQPFMREFRPTRAFLIQFAGRQKIRIGHLIKRHTQTAPTQDVNYPYKQVLGTVKFLRVCNGCLGKCAYCAIRFATGELRSKPLSECAREFSHNLRQGNRRFTLSAEDVGAYGLDIGSSFAELLSEYESKAIGIPYKLLIETFNPQWAVKYRDKIAEMIRTGRIERISCDIQSGSAKILRLMNRYSDLEALSGVLSDFMAIDQSVEYYSQFIIGFPSETDDDFNATMNLIKRLNLKGFTLFPYSDMEGTPASKMPDKIPDKVIAQRLDLAAKILGDRYATAYDSQGNAHNFLKR